MIVKDLIKLLEKEDPNALVVIQKDPEGNYYSPLNMIDGGFYSAYSIFNGYSCLKELTPEARSLGFSEEDVDENAVSALFLVPNN